MKKNTLVKLLAVLVMCFMIGAVLVACDAGEPGKDGAPGAPGAPGADGKDGSVVTIIEVDGVKYWAIDGENTGVKAEGKDGVNATDCDNHDWTQKTHVLVEHEDGEVGKTLVICANCGDADFRVDGHKFDEIIGFVQPTKTEIGSVTVKCDCGATENVDLPVLTDDFYTLVEGNCIIDDKYTFTLTESDVEYAFDIAKTFVVEGSCKDYDHVPAVAFDKDNVADCWELSLDYVDPGEVCLCEMKTHWTTPCTVEGCDYIIGADPFGEAYLGYPLDHIWGEWHNSENETEACSCEWIPIQLRECDRCDCVKCTEYRYEDGATAKGHDWGDWDMIVAPTLTTAGKAVRVCNTTCLNCAGKDEYACKQEIDLPNLEDEAWAYDEAAKLPTCDTKGLTTYTYVLPDGKTLQVSGEIAELGHTLSTKYELIDNNTKVKIECSVCGKSVQYDLPAHDSGEYEIVINGQCFDREDTYTYTVKAQGKDNGELEITFTKKVSDPHKFNGSNEKPAKELCTPVVDEEDGHTYYVYKCEVCGTWIVAYFE